MKKSEIIVTAAASLGVIGSSVLTGIATHKTDQKINQFKTENDRPPTKKELFLLSAKEYLPAVGIVAATIGCIVGGNVLSKKSQASLASAYALMDQSYRKYRKKIIEEFGEEIDKNIREQIVRENCFTSIPHEPGAPGQLLFFEEISEQYFYRTMLEVADAEYHFNRNLVMRGYANLNEFYEFLGLKPTNYGKKMGWNLYLGETEYGYQWVDFEHQLVDECTDPDTPPFYIIHMPFPPHPGYKDGDFDEAYLSKI